MSGGYFDPLLKKEVKEKRKRKTRGAWTPHALLPSAYLRTYSRTITFGDTVLFAWLSVQPANQLFPFFSTSQPAGPESDISESDRPRTRPLIVVLHAMRFTGMPAFALLQFPSCRRDLWGCRRDLWRHLCRRGKWLLCRGRWAFLIFRNSRGVHWRNTLQPQSSAPSPRTGLCGSAQAWWETFQ